MAAIWNVQTVRYAAMVSTITFDRLVDIYSDYIKANDFDLNAETSLLGFLNWDEKDEGKKLKLF